MTCEDFFLRRPSNSVKAVSQALLDLSARIGKEKKDKVVVKIMWDRGSFEQLIKCVRTHGRGWEALTMIYALLGTMPLFQKRLGSVSICRRRRTCQTCRSR